MYSLFDIFISPISNKCEKLSMPYQCLFYCCLLISMKNYSHGQSSHEHLILLNTFFQVVNCKKLRINLPFWIIPLSKTNQNSVWTNKKHSFPFQSLFDIIQSKNMNYWKAWHREMEYLIQLYLLSTLTKNAYGYLEQCTDKIQNHTKQLIKNLKKQILNFMQDSKKMPMATCEQNWI